MKATRGIRGKKPGVMRRFFNNSNGAVTVFVSLLLIPAMLVSGTAVDLARVYTARSIIQDANQLAANSVLTQYNALLYDIYGLMGVAEDDPILAELLDEYIRVAVFGERMQDRTLGTLQLFYGANISLEEIYFPQDKNLRDEDILRRQIEEYMKFRGPVIIVQEFFDAVDSNNLKGDTRVVNDKLGIESDIADIYGKYKRLYFAIFIADKCDQVSGGIAGGTVGTVSSRLTAIYDQFVDLKECYQSWKGELVPSRVAEHEKHYKAILRNIRAYAIGGSIGSNWRDGAWQRTGNSQGLNVTIENAKLHADAFKPKFDSVQDIAREIDGKRIELERKIDELETRIQSGECSEELRDALTEQFGEPPRSLIERYRDMLKWDNIEAMAITYRNGGNSYIDDQIKPLLDGVTYRNINNPLGRSLTRAELENLPSDTRFALSGYSSPYNSMAEIYGGFPVDSVNYKMPPGFLKFAAHPGRNNAFYEELKAMVDQANITPVKLFDGQEDEDGEDAEEKQNNIIDALLKLVDEAYVGLSNSPLGAKYISDSSTPTEKKLNFFEIVAMLPQAIGDPVIDIINDPAKSLSSAGDYLLLLTYCSSMFSNYTTTRPESIGKTKDDLSGIHFTKTISGVPISPEVNYFFQSEWEYLYNGSEIAGENLSAITQLLFLLRLVCNYITSFKVAEIKVVVTSIRAAFAWIPPLAVVLGELARAAFAAAEAVVDVARLRAGHKVPLMKNANSEWVCSPRGLVKVLGDIGSGLLGGEDASSEEGLSYTNYMMFFFLSKALIYTGVEKDAATELAKRTGNLIEWNIINYENNIRSDEGKMTAASTSGSRFKLIEMKTDFSITTTVDFRMLFLSMIFAQDFSDTRGIGMPTTIPMSVTDYRGY